MGASAVTVACSKPAGGVRVGAGSTSKKSAEKTKKQIPIRDTNTTIDG